MHNRMFVILSLLTTACSSAASMGGDSRIAPPTTKTHTDKETSYGGQSGESPASAAVPAEPVISNDAILNSSTVSEEANRPKAVTGAYLHCVKTAEMQTLVEVGCRFDDESGNRVDPLVIAQSITYTVVKPTASDVSLSTFKPQSSYRLYDLVLTYDSVNLERSLAALADTQIKVVLVEPKITVESATITRVVSEVLVPSPVSKESKFVVYKAENETVVLDRIAGNYFVRITGAKRSWNQAKTDCRNLTISGLSWGLTAWGPLELLFEHGVRDDAAAVEALGLKANTVVWDQHELPDDPSWAYTLILWDGSATQVGWNYANKSDVLARPFCLY